MCVCLSDSLSVETGRRGSAKGPYEESKCKAKGRIVGAQALKLEAPGPALGVALSPTEDLTVLP